MVRVRESALIRGDSSCLRVGVSSRFLTTSWKESAPSRPHPTSKFIEPSSLKCDRVGPKIAASPSLSELFNKATKVLWNEGTRNLSPNVRDYWMVSA